MPKLVRLVAEDLIDLGEYSPNRYYLKQDIAIFPLWLNWNLMVPIRSTLFCAIWDNLSDCERATVKFARPIYLHQS